jgi:hypothetical protein
MRNRLNAFLVYGISTAVWSIPYILDRQLLSLPITLAALSRAWTIFARSNTGVVGSNTTRGMDVCVRLFCVVPCVGSGLATGWSPIQGVLPTVYRIKKLKKRRRVNIERERERELLSSADVCQNWETELAKLIFLEEYVLWVVPLCNSERPTFQLNISPPSSGLAKHESSLTKSTCLFCSDSMYLN